MSRFKYKIKLQIDVITPVIINSGHKFSPFEYVVRKVGNSLQATHHTTPALREMEILIFNPLQAINDIPELKRYVLQYDITPTNAGDFLYNVKKQISNNLIYLRTRQKYKAYLHEKFKLKGDLASPYLNLSSPYYPGSTIKGKLKTFLGHIPDEFNILVPDIPVNTEDIVYLNYNCFYQLGHIRPKYGDQTAPMLRPNTFMNITLQLTEQRMWATLQNQVRRYYQTISLLSDRDQRIALLKNYINNATTPITTSHLEIYTYLGFGSGRLGKISIDSLSTYRPTKCVKLVTLPTRRKVPPGLVKLTLTLK